MEAPPLIAPPPVAPVAVISLPGGFVPADEVDLAPLVVPPTPAAHEAPAIPPSPTTAPSPPPEPLGAQGVRRTNSAWDPNDEITDPEGDPTVLARVVGALPDTLTEDPVEPDSAAKDDEETPRRPPVALLIGAAGLVGVLLVIGLAALLFGGTLFGFAATSRLTNPPAPVAAPHAPSPPVAPEPVPVPPAPPAEAAPAPVEEVAPPPPAAPKERPRKLWPPKLKSDRSSPPPVAPPPDEPPNPWGPLPDAPK